jgi:hypothetical protein
MVPVTPKDPIAERLAVMASAGFELGGSARDVARDVTAMWVDLGSPAGAFDAAAAAVATLPQRPEIPVSEQARRAAFERLAGINSVEQELTAALAARELLQRLARLTPGG